MDLISRMPRDVAILVAEFVYGSGIIVRKGGHVSFRLNIPRAVAQRIGAIPDFSVGLIDPVSGSASKHVNLAKMYMRDDYSQFYVSFRIAIQQRGYSAVSDSLSRDMRQECLVFQKKIVWSLASADADAPTLVRDAYSEFYKIVQLPAACTYDHMYTLRK